MNRYIPTQDFILVEKNGPTEKKGSIYLPVAQQDPQNVGTVRAVGPGRRGDNGNYINPDIHVGDVVMFNRAFNLEGNFLLVKENEIFCKIKGD